MVRNLKVERQGGSQSHDVCTVVNKKRAKLFCKLLCANRLMVRQTDMMIPQAYIPLYKTKSGPAVSMQSRLIPNTCSGRQ